MDNLLEIKKSPNRVLAIELVALNPSITNKELSKELKLSEDTIKKWRKDPEFIESSYKRFITEIEAKSIPLIVKSMAREAIEGNVQAARFIFEALNKLGKSHVHIHISPWEQFIEKEKLEKVDSSIIVESEIIDVQTGRFDELPPRNKENQDVRAKKEKFKNRMAIKEAEKKAIRNKKQKEWYNWRKRAKVAGIEPLKSKRPTPAQRKDWERAIINAESQSSHLSQSQTESTDNNRTPDTDSNL